MPYIKFAYIIALIYIMIHYIKLLMLVTQIIQFIPLGKRIRACWLLSK